MEPPTHLLDAHGSHRGTSECLNQEQSAFTAFKWSASCISKLLVLSSWEPMDGWTRGQQCVTMMRQQLHLSSWVHFGLHIPLYLSLCTLLASRAIHGVFSEKPSGCRDGKGTKMSPPLEGQR